MSNVTGIFSKRSAGGDSVPDRLARCAEKRDVPALLSVLDGLDDNGWAAARRWYRTARTSLRRTTDTAQFRGLDRFLAGVRVEALLCVALAPPASAARWLRWEWLGQSVQVVTPTVVRRGPEWCAEFVTAVDRRPQRRDTWGLTGALYQVLRTAVDAYDLPTPTGEAFVEGWMTALTLTIGPQAVTGVTERLRAEPRLDDLVEPVVSHPQLGQYASVAVGLAELARDGLVDRARLVDLCLAGLDSPGRPAGQKALAETLTALGLGAEELPGGLARLQQLLATCHGSVTSRLLPLAVELVTNEDDLVELTTTIAARPEKKQRADLLRAIVSGPIARRVPAEGRRAALEILADSPDAALAGRAARALEALGGPVFEAPHAAAAVLGLWDRIFAVGSEPTIPVPEPLSTDDQLRQIREAAAGSTAFPVLGPWQEPVALSTLVRWAYRDGEKAVRRMVGEVELSPHSPTLFGPALAAWVHKRLPPPWAPILVPVITQNQCPSPLVERHLRESFARAGRIPFLLSTPTHTDASLDFGVLVERLRRSPDLGFGPLDLLLAVLRLGPVAPGRAVELDGLAPVPPDRTAERTAVRDAVAYVREAVAAGRLLPPPVTASRMADEDWVPEQPQHRTHRFVRAREGQPPDAFWAAMLPVPLADFGTHLDELAPTGSLWHRDRIVLRSVVPWQADLRLRSTGLWQEYGDWWMGQHHLDSRGPVGVACHDLLLAGYAADRPDSRKEMVELTLAWIGAGRYAVEPGLAATWARLRIGRLNLARCAAAWEQVFLAGGMRAAWPVALGAAGQAAELKRKPSGLAELLRVLTQYVGEAPLSERALPPAIEALAAARGSTKSHAEARLLAAAARGCTA